MKFFEPKFEIVEQEPGIEGLYKIIEECGRTCYKSNSKIHEGSAERFVNAMIKSNHGAMLEHGTVYLRIPRNRESMHSMGFYLKNKFSTVVSVSDYDYVTTNYRVIVENNCYDDLKKYWCEPTEYHEKRVCVRFWMDRVGSQSCERHRVFSFAQESTRYVNYSLEKNDGEVRISIPHWTDRKEIESFSDEERFGPFLEFMEEFNNEIPEKVFKPICERILYWIAACEFCEWCYMKLLECGLSAEDARGILPLCIDSEFCMTGLVSDWQHWFDLRADDMTGPSHPDIHKIANAVKSEFIAKGFIEDKKQEA